MRILIPLITILLGTAQATTGPHSVATMNVSNPIPDDDYDYDAFKKHTSVETRTQIQHSDCVITEMAVKSALQQSEFGNEISNTNFSCLPDYAFDENYSHDAL